MEHPATNFILSLLAYAAQRDILPERLCTLANIDEGWLTAENKTPLTDKQLDDLWLNAVHLSKDRYFGLHFGESLQLSALGIVGEIIKSSRTVGDAVSTAAEIGQLITSSFTFKVSKLNDTFTIYINPVEENWQESVTAIQTLDVLMVFIIHELDGLLLKKISPLIVTYIPGIATDTELERVLRCKPFAFSEENAITFDLKYWDEPIITANYELQKFFKEKMQVFMQTTAPEERFADKINRHLVANAYLGILSLEEIAANFNISPRTLQRRLKDEQMSFQQLTDNARRYLAVQALKQGGHAIKEIAWMLGYNELSAFSRAFKRWTGISPDAYRLQA